MPLSLQRLENLYREPLLLLLGKPKPELFRQESVLAAVRYGCRSRKLTKAGPKDAVQIALDDVALEHRNDPKVMAQARVEAQEFLQRVREGSI